MKLTKDQKQRRVNYQAAINEACINEYDKALTELQSLPYKPFKNRYKQLKSCKATYCETSHYTILFSYDTMVCVFNKVSSNVFDFSRYVYGYTATTSSHINKFINMFYYANKYTYYDILNTKIWYRKLPAYFDFT